MPISGRNSFNGVRIPLPESGLNAKRPALLLISAEVEAAAASVWCGRGFPKRQQIRNRLIRVRFVVCITNVLVGEGKQKPLSETDRGSIYLSRIEV